MLHRGYTGVCANGDGEKGEAECPFEFCKNFLGAFRPISYFYLPTYLIIIFVTYHPFLRSNIFLLDKTWVNNPQEAQRMVEKVTRSTIGVRCCPVPGIPPPKEEEEDEELTHELNLQ